jgi:hypothetical protein
MTGRLWPAHPKPMPDELLSSWIVRIVRANGLKLQTFCDFAFGKAHQLWNRDIDRLAPEWLLRELAARTGTGLARVRKTTLRIYEGLFYEHWRPSGQLRWILCTGVYHRKRTLFGMQFCPQCLREDAEPYFRTHWRIAALTFCPRHLIALHDRCPACGAAVAFHRRELGRPQVVDTGPLCLCHACEFDLRNAECVSFEFYDEDIRSLLLDVGNLAAGKPSTIDLGWLAVLHQLCKIMVSTRVSAKLAKYIALMVAAHQREISRGRYAFELRALPERSHVAQLAAWLLADPVCRLERAWKVGAVRYSDLVRDIHAMPSWYTEATDGLNRRKQVTSG